MNRAWVNPAGGLRYHWRALTSSELWAPFSSALAHWFASLNFTSPRALLVGPSAAYTFPDAFLRRFAAFTLLEPDPLAGYLLTRRLHRLGVREVRLERRDLLLRPLLDGGDGLPELLASYPSQALIFCNVLGQTRFLLEDSEFDRFKAAFRERIGAQLSSRSWLSIHDRWSGRLEPEFDAPLETAVRLDDTALRALYPRRGPSRAVELFDHQSDGFFPNARPHAYFSWQLAPNRFHLIEGVAGSG